MIHSIFNSVMGFGIGNSCCYYRLLVIRSICKGIITNIVLGGVLYLFLDWFHICKNELVSHGWYYSCTSRNRAQLFLPSHILYSKKALIKAFLL